MRVSALHIENFRAIQSVTLSELPDAVVLAGPNGCGKSCVLDALRLLKSAYGQYHENEYQKWFSEFQINIQQLVNETNRVLQNPRLGLVIQADFALTTDEKAFIRVHARELAEELAWSRATPRGAGLPFAKPVIAPTERRVHGRAVGQATDEMLSSLESELASPIHRADLRMDPAGTVQIQPSTVLELVFCTYQPTDIGVIDYHSSNRNYARENVGNVKLNVSESDTRSRQSALYDTQNKYTNVKTEMASAYVREMLAERGGFKQDERSNLVETLQELFTIFLPGKRFLGPQPMPDGRLLFQVELENGSRHDIDELSSGEKEVLLGYLRLRNSSPRNSVILLDEPELHLNPRLIRGLATFYQKNIAAALNNQLWLITHSDTLLREAVERPEFAVFQMQPANAVSGEENQVTRISVSEHVERAVIDLVGDLATYSPHSRIVLLEGGGESEFDLNIIRQLFPEFAARVNLVSGGRKARVRELHSLLEQTVKNGNFNARFFSIVDRDTEECKSEGVARRYSWDAYHIENYLLEASYLRRVASVVLMNSSGAIDETLVTEQLEMSAKDTIDDLVRIRMQRHVNDRLVGCINIGASPTGSHVAADYRRAAESSAQRIQVQMDGPLGRVELERLEAQVRQGLADSIQNGTWRRELRGRNILKRFQERMKLKLPYAAFRNLIISEMKRDGYKPAGMQQIISLIFAS